MEQVQVVWDVGLDPAGLEALEEVDQVEVLDSEETAAKLDEVADYQWMVGQEDPEDQADQVGLAGQVDAIDQADDLAALDRGRVQTFFRDALQEMDMGPIEATHSKDSCVPQVYKTIVPSADLFKHENFLSRLREFLRKMSLIKKRRILPAHANAAILRRSNEIYILEI